MDEGQGRRSVRHHARVANRILLIAAGACGLASLLLTGGYSPGTPARSVGSWLEVPAVLLFVLEHISAMVLAGSWRAALRRRRAGHVVLAILLIETALVVTGVRGGRSMFTRSETLVRFYLISLQIYVFGSLLVAAARLNARVLRLRLRPAALAFLAFIFLITIGTVLLLLPNTMAPGQRTTLIDALFTATSASCVTGLIVVDTATHFSRLGQGVILGLIQLGGLGIMVITAVVALVAGGGFGLRERAVLSDVLNVGFMRQLTSTVRFILVATLVMELLGAGALFLGFSAPGLPLGTRIFDSVFHSISAFCNAGFSTFSDSLIGYRAVPAVVLPVMVLLIVGGLGFVVLQDLWRLLRQSLRGRIARRRSEAGLRLTVQTRIVLSISALLLVAGAAVFLGNEWRGALGDLPGPLRLLNGVFMAATPRTAGFTTTDPALWTAPGIFMLILLMLIGGASGSTAGGMKVTTFGVMLAAVRSMIRGRQQPILHRRGISPENIREAVVVLTVYLTMLSVGALVLLVSEGRSLQTTLFETASALGTVGLSLGLTAELTVLGKLVVVLLMLLGRLGPLTVALVVARALPAAPVQYPQERVMIG